MRSRIRGDQTRSAHSGFALGQSGKEVEKVGHARFPHRVVTHVSAGVGHRALLADRFPSYGTLKQTVTDAVIAELDPIRHRHDTLTDDPGELTRVLRAGADRARVVADQVLVRAEAAIGLV